MLTVAGNCHMHNQGFKLMKSKSVHYHFVKLYCFIILTSLQCIQLCLPQ